MRTHSKHCPTSFSELLASQRTKRHLSSIVFSALSNGLIRFFVSSAVPEISGPRLSTADNFTLIVDTDKGLLEKPRESREILERRAFEWATAHEELCRLCRERTDITMGNRKGTLWLIGVEGTEGDDAEGAK